MAMEVDPSKVKTAMKPTGDPGPARQAAPPRLCASLSDARRRVREYSEGVISGRIVAGKWVRAAVLRHLVDLKEGKARGLRFDEKAAWHAVKFFGFLRHSKGEWAGQRFVLSDWQVWIIWVLFGWRIKVGQRLGPRRFRTAWIELARKNGKALALDTDIPTPDGWTTMGQLQVGDIVFDDRGQPCRVTAVTPVMTGHRCYKVCFSDGETIIADADHQWVTESRCLHGKVGIRTTEEIAASVMVPYGRYRERNHRIGVAGPLATAESTLPVPPYILGAWLGDGHTACNRLTFAVADREITEHIAAAGGSVGKETPHGHTNAVVVTLGTAGHRPCPSGGRSNAIRDGLREIDVLGNKHIPPSYLRASIAQRMELLRGLMDTDGYVSKAGQCEFTTTLPRLRDDFIELARSLGYKPTLKTAIATLNGRPIGEKYRIQFWSYSDRPAFRMSRKSGRLKPTPTSPTRATTRQITDVRPMPSVPVRCIEVDSPSHMYLAGRAMVPTHNSTLAAGIGLYLFDADGEFGAEVYTAATKRDQARIVHGEAVRMVRKSPPLRGRLTIRRDSLVAEDTESKFEPLGADEDTLDGLNVHGSIVDEVHAHRNRTTWDVINTATGARRQPLIVGITTAGSDEGSVCYEQHKYGTDILEKTVADDSVFVYIAALDDSRTELFSSIDGVKELGTICTCGRARTIRIAKLFAEVCAELATRPGTGDKVGSDVRNIQIDQPALAECAAVVTSIGSYHTIRNSESEDRSTAQNGPKRTETKREPQDIDGERRTEHESLISNAYDSTESRGSNSFKCSPTPGINAQSAERPTGDCASIIATLRKLFGASFATNATAQLACSETLKRALFEHSDICNVRKLASVRSDGRLAIDLPGDDWTDERNWIKANPNLGVSAKWEKLRQEAKKAKEIPAARNTFLRLHLNRWTRQKELAVPMEKWNECSDAVNAEALAGRRCFGALDLSKSGDITALILLFPPTEADPVWRVLCWFWAPESSLEKLTGREKQRMQSFVDAGLLELTEGNVTDYDAVIAKVLEAREKFNLVDVAFDPWNAMKVAQDLTKSGVTMVEFPQRIGTFNEPTKQLLELVAGAKIAHGGHAVLKWMASNLEVKTDANQNMRPVKPDYRQSPNRIDGMVALIMALGRAMVTDGGGGSVYEERGLVVL